MGSTQIGDDRISKLADGVLGHILSFLPAQEAARAAAFSTRWRDIFAGVHTVSFEEPEEPIPSYDDHYCSYSPGYGPPEDPNPPPPFTAVVTAALLARHPLVLVRPDDAAAKTLRAFRVDMETYRGSDSSTVDSWVSYAQREAGAQLEIDLRLRRAPICTRPYSLHVGRSSAVSLDQEEDEDVFNDAEDSRADHIREAVTHRKYIDVSPHNEATTDDSAADDVDEAKEYDGVDSSADHVKEATTDDDADGYPADDDGDAITDEEYDDVVSLESEKAAYVRPWELPPPEYTMPRGLFSCTALRSLRVGPCRLSPPAMIRLPSLEELRLTLLSDDGQDVQRLVSACPRLADLTLEACDKVTALSLLDTRLRRLALRCCHNLASVAVDLSELQSFEYRGSVPEDSFLTMCASASGSSLRSCKVDICGQEVSSEEELTKLKQFLQLFVDTKHLHLQSARLGSGFHNDTFISFQEFPNLRHLELMGCLPEDDATIVSAMSRLLQHAPELEVLSLIFHPEPGPCGDDDYKRLPGGNYGCDEAELLDVHDLEYNQYNILEAQSAMTAACLRHGVREINLVHYQGGRAQRSLAKFLLCNAQGLYELYCGFAPGPLWIQNELRLEIERWARNKPENRIFC